MLSGSLEVKWGDQLEQTVTIGPGDMVYVPPRETHLLTNLSDAEAAEYVVARDSPTEDSVEVPGGPQRGRPGGGCPGASWSPRANVNGGWVRKRRRRRFGGPWREGVE